MTPFKFFHHNTFLMFGAAWFLIAAGVYILDPACVFAGNYQTSCDEEEEEEEPEPNPEPTPEPEPPVTPPQPPSEPPSPPQTPNEPEQPSTPSSPPGGAAAFPTPPAPPTNETTTETIFPPLVIWSEPLPLPPVIVSTPPSNDEGIGGGDWPKELAPIEKAEGLNK